MRRNHSIERLWDTSILTALQPTQWSGLFICGSFLIISIISFLISRPYQEFMFFFYGIPVVYAGLVFGLPRAFGISIFALAVHVASSWGYFQVLSSQGQFQSIIIEGFVIVIAYLFSCLFITKILINERENQKELLNMADLNAQVAQELAQANHQLNQVYTHTIQALAAAIDAKDPYTKGHSERVTNYAVAVAKQMNLSEKDVQNIFYAAILHDIGKIGIDESILKKPGPLTTSEFKEIKKHTEIGATILASIPFLEEVVPIVLHHHEYYNGEGYPKGLYQQEIPIGARIISIVDAFDAITTDRPYRNGYNRLRALDDLARGTGKQFDPRIVAIFSKMVEEGDLYPESSDVVAAAQANR